MQRGDALAVGRQLVQRHAAVGRPDRLDPVGSMAAEVLHREEAAVGLGEGDEGLGDLARVEGVPALLSDQTQALGQVRVAEDLALLRRLAVGQEGHREPRLVAEDARGAIPRGGDHLRHGPALLGGADGRREHVLHRHAAELAVQREPAVDGARHGPGVGAVERDPAALGRLHLVRRQRQRRAPRAVQAVELLRLLVPDDREEVAADAVGGGLEEAERGVDRDRGVHRAPTGLEDVHADLHCRRVRRGDHPVLAVDDRPGREHLALGPIRALHARPGEHHDPRSDDETTHRSLSRSFKPEKPRKRGSSYHSENLPSAHPTFAGAGRSRGVDTACGPSSKQEFSR